ncbi:1718_t:CDS:2 [Dentiscutata erythropus]|uniref:Nucleoside diphosphate kinase n=1 Tax=Dentiscutata erythropus TaxID=1348616 RepID=A0A9N9B5P3_9GLOM|nr:1718_t:CDS:2 [Dentiscutata erythropus]
MSEERTYIMVKPDGVERGLVGEIIKRFENKGYKLVALQLLPVDMLSGPVVGMVWEGKDIVKTGRRLLGETDPLKSAPGTIRGDFCIDVGKNLCHGSDSVESAQREINLWFPNGVISWERHNVHKLIYE